MTLPAHVEAELARLGVVAPKKHAPVHIPEPAPKPWKPAFEGDEPPF